jgi:hypothetical protein
MNADKWDLNGFGETPLNRGRFPHFQPAPKSREKNAKFGIYPGINVHPRLSVEKKLKSRATC